MKTKVPSKKIPARRGAGPEKTTTPSKRELLEIGGYIRWADGTPAVNATVLIYRHDRPRDGALVSAHTDARGRFAMVAESGGGLFYFVVMLAGRVVLSTSRNPMAFTEQHWEVHVEIPDAAPRSRARSTSLVRPKLLLGDISVDAKTVENATPDTVRALARSMSGRPLPKRERRLVETLTAGLRPLRQNGITLCGTQQLVLIEEIIRAKRWPRELRLEIDDILALRDSNFAQAVHDCVNFSITYQTSGPDAVDPDTSAADVIDPGSNPPVIIGSLPAGGPPTYIKRVCFWLERALAAYVNPPFSMLNPAAAGKIPVVINGWAYGSASPSGTFYLNHALNADLLCAVAVHELFHMVQFMYPGNGTWRWALLEGGAVFAEDTAADLMNRYLDECGTNFNGTGVLGDPNLSVSSGSYKSCLFWRYLSEQQSPDVTEPFIGVETYRTVLEHCSAGSHSTADVKLAIQHLPWYQDFYEFGFLDPTRLDRTSSETVWGNYALACYLKELGTNLPDSRYDFIEDDEDIFIDQVIPGAPPSSTLVPVTLAGNGTVTSASAVSFNASVNSFAHRYYEVTVDPALNNVQVDFTAGAGLTSLIFQIALIDTAGQVRDLHRTDATTYSKRLTSLRGGVRLQKIALVVSGADSAGSFTLNVASAAPAPDVMITRWHSVMRTEYEIDSRNWAWTWVSPDIWVDNDNNGIADGDVFFDFNNKLHVRLHNKGNAAASSIQIDLSYQSAASGLSPNAWLPVQDKLGVTQIITGASLAAGATNDWTVDWSPVAVGSSNHFCVRGVVTVPGDPNTDNKRAQSNFGNVIVNPNGYVDLPVWAIAERFRGLGKPKIKIIPRCDPEFLVLTRDVREADLIRSEATPDLVRVRHRKLSAFFPPEKEEVKSKSRKSARDKKAAESACRVHLLHRTPDPAGFYPTDPRALPPGVARQPMITIAHEIDGKTIGGVTFMLTVGKSRARRKSARPAKRRK